MRTHMCLFFIPTPSPHPSVHFMTPVLLGVCRLTMLEAMASARPVIITGAGAAMDFANEDTAYLIRATEKVWCAACVQPCCVCCCLMLCVFVCAGLWYVLLLYMCMFMYM